MSNRDFSKTAADPIILSNNSISEQVLVVHADVLAALQQGQAGR